MNIKGEIDRIRKLMHSNSNEVRNPKADPALAEKPFIDAISEGELHVDKLHEKLRVMFDYVGMREGQKVELHLFGNTQGPGDHSVCVIVKEVKVHTVFIPKEKVEQLRKNELGMCVYFIDDKETSNWTTFTVR